MEKEELDLFIEKLDKTNLEEDSYIGFFNVEHENYKFIKANKEGLRRYASTLLKISNYEIFDATIIDEKFIDSRADHYFEFVEMTDSKGGELLIDEPKTTLKENLVGIGMIILLTIIILCSIVGLLTVIKWLF